MSYQKLNQFAGPFYFHIPCCNNAVHAIYTKAKYFIAVDMDSGYWQLMAEEEACARLSFFDPAGNGQWKVMPMVSLKMLELHLGIP